MKWRKKELSKCDFLDNPVRNILENRGIKDWEYYYMGLSKNVVIDYNKLNNIKNAVECFTNHFDNRNTISILIDEDVDGLTSGAAMYNYIKKIDDNYPVEYIIHKETKSHGISDLVNDVIVPNDTKLLIIPDAGTNDYDSCKCLIERGIDIIILDHHMCEEDGIKNSEQCIIVNNQMSDEYENKDFSGVGIVYKFLKALDDELWCEYADEFLDLVALGNISDVMDVRTYETKYLINIGLKNIKNKAFKSFINGQEFSMKNIINIHNVQWYITPLINAIFRVGNYEDKDLLFRAFIETDETFEYKKRATKSSPAQVLNESIYDRVVRNCKNLKSRQDKIRDKAFKNIIDMTNEIKPNKICVVDVSDVLDNSGLTGVVAIKVAEKLNMPCILLKKKHDENGNLVFGGSGRNINNSPLESLKDVINRSGEFIFAQGHDNAMGVRLDIDNLDNAINKLDCMLKDVVYESEYIVDDIISEYDVDINLCHKIESFDDYIGHMVEEPLVAIKEVRINREDISVFGKTSNTIKFKRDNDVEYVQFFCKEGNQLLDWINDPWGNCDVVVNIVGTPKINNYNNVKTAQVVIKEVQIINKIYGNYNTINDCTEDEDIW